VDGGTRLGRIFWPQILCVLLERTHAAGKYPDFEISRSGLAHWLGEFGRVEADDGDTSGRGTPEGT